MVLAARVESTLALCALAPALQVLVHSQHMPALPTQHSAFASSRPGPDFRRMRLARIVAADACVKLFAAEVFDGDDVEL